jgi:hypothetical protein
MVSRKHAKISTSGDQIFIQDLGSTNGTFVNGEKIKRVRLREGDRVLIGTSIIKLVTIDGPAPEAPKGPLPTSSAVHDETALPSGSSQRRSTGVARSMAGTIDEIPIPDLLQLLSTSKKSGVLQVESKGLIGRIYLRKGQIYYATIGENTDVNPEKAIYRILTWQTGTFELLPPDEREFLNELEESTEGLLMEAMRHMDEIKVIVESLPPANTPLTVAKPLPMPLRELSPDELDMVELVHAHTRLQTIVDKASVPDLTVYKVLADLIKKRVVLTGK